MIALLLSSLAGCQPSPAGRRGDRPDVVLIALDAVRWDHTTLSGYARDTTPALAQLAALPGSLVFRRAYAPAVWSLPSYASVFTGRDAFSHRVGIAREALDPGDAPLAEILAAYGYRSGAFCSGPHLLPETGFARGFEVYQHDPLFAPLTAQVDDALAWVAEARRSPEPYFAFIHGYDAHTPYQVPAAFAELYDPGYEGPAHLRRGCPALPTRSCVLSPGDVLRFGQRGGDPAPHARHAIAHYDSAIRAADYQLGRLLRALERDGALSEAIVVVFADHGQPLGGEGYPEESSQPEALFHVPLVVRLPDRADPAALREDVVSLTGILPTILGELGVPLPAGAEPRGLLEPDPDAIARGAWQDGYLAASAEWELWVEDRAEPSWKLHRPGQREDVAAEHPDAAAALRESVAAWAALRPKGAEEATHGPAGDDPRMRQELRAHGYWAPERPARPDQAQPESQESLESSL